VSAGCLRGIELTVHQHPGGHPGSWLARSGMRPGSAPTRPCWKSCGGQCASGARNPVTPLSILVFPISSSLSVPCRTSWSWGSAWRLPPRAGP
jgi:hypothetical protein